VWTRLLCVSCGAVLLGCALAVGAPPADSWEEHHRAGNPTAIAPWARPSWSPAYGGYSVGGGCPFPRKGEPGHPSEGTWGWDYFGKCFSRRVDLLWWHGRRYQGGTGAYKTDGPKLKEHHHE
jgi:hypothetical protein